MGKKIYILTAVCMMLMILLFIMLDRCNVGAYIGLSDNYDWLAFAGSCLGILVAVYVPIYVLQETLRHEKEDSLRSEKRSICMEIIADISSLIALHKKAVHYASKDNEKENYEHASIEFWEKYSFLKMKLSNLKQDDKYIDANVLYDALCQYATPLDQINNRYGMEKSIMDLFLFHVEALQANDKGLIQKTESFVRKNTESH